MDRQDFLQLLALPGKRIDGDVEFEMVAAKAPALVLRPVDVKNAGGLSIRLCGHYHPTYDAVTFAFDCREAGGPICRVDVRGTMHKQAGRTHKHDLQVDTDPLNNLPQAVARLDLVNLTPRMVWQDLCQRANLIHTGQFIDP